MSAEVTIPVMMTIKPHYNTLLNTSLKKFPIHDWILSHHKCHNLPLHMMTLYLFRLPKTLLYKQMRGLTCDTCVLFGKGRQIERWPIIYTVCTKTS